MPLKVVLGGTIAYDLDGRLNRPEIPIVRDGRHGGKFYSLLTATLVSLEPQ